ncbi:MAG: leucine-rich repeat domain-containing protein, partial [Muribaculaceae bacterium]|nr:leucine-rich repeat domain-containing protein [Muribaculaceae bacterium]
DISWVYSFAFYGCTNLQEVIFLGDIPTFKEGAFYNCNNIDRVEIQPGYLAAWCLNSTDYSWDRPYGTNFCIGPKVITDLEIPEEISVIASYAFYGFHNIESVHWPHHTVSVRSGGLPFSNIKTIHCNSISDWMGSSIDGRPFFPATKLYINNKPCPAIITLPEGITQIGNMCMNGNSEIEELVIPQSVVNIGYGAFMGCKSLKKLTIKTKNIGYQEDLFSGCTSLDEVILDCNGIFIGSQIPLTDSPTRIFRFYNSAISYDTEVNTSSIKEVYTNNLAMWCENRSVLNSQAKLYINDIIPDSIEIPNGVSIISNEAFIGQDYSSVTLPASVKSIGELALSDVKQIVCMASTPPTIKSNTFANVNKSECMVFVPESSIDLYRDAQYWNEFMNITSNTTRLYTTETDRISIYFSDKTIEISNIKPTTDVRIYNISGLELNRTIATSNSVTINHNLQHGVYYIVVGNEAQKVIL